MTIVIFLFLMSLNLFGEGTENVPKVEDKVESTSVANEKVQGLFLYSNINTLNFSWKDLSVDGAESFINPLNQNWIEWFKQSQQTFKIVEACTNSCIPEFNSWIEGTVLENRSGIWVKTDLNLRRLEDDRFEISGGIVFLDIGNRKNLGARTLELQKISLPIVDLKKKNSSLASYLFRSTLPVYNSLLPTLNYENNSRSMRLVVKGFSSLSDLQALEKLLNEKSPALNLKSNLVSFARNEAQLEISFKGEEKLFSDLLSELKELKSSRRYTLVHEFTETNHVLKMIAE